MANIFEHYISTNISRRFAIESVTAILETIVYLRSSFSTTTKTAPTLSLEYNSFQGNSPVLDSITTFATKAATRMDSLNDGGTFQIKVSVFPPDVVFGGLFSLSFLKKAKESWTIEVTVHSGVDREESRRALGDVLCEVATKAISEVQLADFAEVKPVAGRTVLDALKFQIDPNEKYFENTINGNTGK
eukprot:TRINITY_DN8955_c0_g1_i1.p1 TRINITY_DN8955_c0_g1~~TRINITY_DN8955_c0_g1_i1.p1  ORF type:complete len:188 (+),score=29.62 TRINITY_DN8955_c0_g1_i1:12-575(+)